MAGASQKPAEDSGRVWFGFGFGQFGQIVSEQCLSICVPTLVKLYPGGPGDSCPADLSKLSPAWSRTGALTVDGHLVLAGFLGGCPQQCSRFPGLGCRDLLVTEKYLMLIFKDSVKCWNTDTLTAECLQGDSVWQMDLPENNKKAFPLVSDGYVMPKPPFFKKLPCDIHVQKLVLGKEHAVLLSCDWEVFSWGSGRHGQLGHGSLEDVSEPLVVEALQGMPMADVAAGSWHSVSVSEAGDIYIWGWNESGQLGLPSKHLSESRKGTATIAPQEKLQLPFEMSETRNTTSLEEADRGSSSDQKIVSLAETLGSVNKDCIQEGEFISIQAFPALLDLPENSEVLHVRCGSRHTAVVTREGNLYTWGWGAYGQLGHGDTKSIDQPKLAEYFPQNELFVKDVVCGLWNTYVMCVSKTNGR